MNGEHPILSSVSKKQVFFVICLFLVIVQSVLLVWIANYELAEAIVDSFVSVAALAFAGIALWYVVAFLSFYYVLVVLSLVVQLAVVCIAYIIDYSFEIQNNDLFIKTIPFRVLYGLFCWIILLLWYDKQRLISQLTDIDEDAEKSETEVSVTISDENELLERISVKNGTRIHLIQLDEIYYIQACGDYVSFFTTSGEYLKEQTMKYFEEHLPSKKFIRIHRSCIVNTEYIARIELFGKENYQVRLKNGSILKASLSGYKLLRDKLEIS